jgi:hypothetical protein
MNKRTYLQLKAGFLLAVFALNIMVGFACAMDIDMGFNNHHHEEEETQASEQSPTHGIKHHHHDEASEHHHDKKDGSKKDGCCNDKVVKLSQTDKAIPQQGSVINPVFASTFISSFYGGSILFTSQVSRNNKYFVRSYHPPIPDIRIAIQSFQI